jgi:sugar-specific transcriptional regulator TrmB
MKALIETARKEITIFISYPAVLNALKDSLIEAREKRRVRLKVAITQEVLEKEGSSDLGEIRLLCCASEMIDSLGMVISDQKTLLNVSNWTGETALLTQDKNLIQVARDYFDSPSCCTDVRQNR